MADEVPDKKYLYGNFQKQEDERNKLHLRAAHKALDIAQDDDVNINTTKNTTSGVGALGIAGVALAGGIPSLIAAALFAFSGPKQTTVQAPPPAAPTAPAQAGPVDSSYDVLFYDADGKRIDIPPITARPR